MINKLINIYKRNKQVINYIIFGVLTTVVNLVTYFLLTSFWLDAKVWFQLQVANVISWIMAVLFAYVTNRKYVFESKNKNKLKEVKDFFLARFATLLEDMIIMYLGVSVLRISDKLIKLISQVMVIVSNYVLSKLFVFKVDANSINVRSVVMSKNKSKDKLYIIIPAYNEEENIEVTVKEWHAVVKKINKESRLVVIDDGSRDNTYNKLLELKEKYFQLDVITKDNSGHGATVLYGYNYAINNKADYIFQTDSDGQTISDEFWQFWNERRKYNAIIGSRKNRQDGISRIFVTKILKLVLFLVFHDNVEDANTPFRLIKRSVLEECCRKIPKDFNLSNVLLTVLLLKEDKKKVKFIPITFRPRQGGVNSINLKKITKIGVRAVKDFRIIKKSLK